MELAAVKRIANKTAGMASKMPSVPPPPPPNMQMPQWRNQVQQHLQQQHQHEHQHQHFLSKQILSVAATAGTTDGPKQLQTYQHSQAAETSSAQTNGANSSLQMFASPYWHVSIGTNALTQNHQLHGYKHHATQQAPEAVETQIRQISDKIHQANKHAQTIRKQQKH